MKNILKQFGNRVRELRKAQGLSQEELAEKAGLHFTYVGGIERGERNLSLKSIERIAIALKIDIRDFFVPHLAEVADMETNQVINDINNILITKESGILQLIRQLVKDIDDWSIKPKHK